MPVPHKLTETEIKDYLEDIPLWNLDGGEIVRELVGANFPAAIGIVNSIAVIAEAMDHHPDIFIYGWNKVRIRLTTHSAGGLTENDFELAKKIEKLNI
jgi:4a-hydroxytetrahydrobiopterin dehydratase